MTTAVDANLTVPALDNLILCHQQLKEATGNFLQTSNGENRAKTLSSLHQVHKSLQALSKATLPDKYNYTITKLQDLITDLKALGKGNTDQVTPQLFYHSAFIGKSLMEFFEDSDKFHRSHFAPSDTLLSSVKDLERNCEALSQDKTKDRFWHAFDSLARVTSGLRLALDIMDTLTDIDSYIVTQSESLISDINDMVEAKGTSSLSEREEGFRKLCVDSRILCKAVDLSCEPQK